MKMPTKPHPHPHNKVQASSDVNPEVGDISEEIEVPVASDVVFRKIWKIRGFRKTIKNRDSIDSPNFRCSVNGLTTFWNISVRFWKGPNGKKITNPLVVCLNLTGSETEETGQARVRFQFGIWDASIKHWECCPISSVVLTLENKKELLSVGYKSLGVLDRHLDNPNKDVRIMLKLQIIQSDEEVHSLSQDMARLYSMDDDKDTLIECGCASSSEPSQSKTIKAHSWIIRIRSTKLGSRLLRKTDSSSSSVKYNLDLSELALQTVTELLRYIYTDKVDNADSHASKLLPLSTRFQLPGLTALCERTLLESLTPNNVANVLLLADQCGCENLRKAALHYCENSDEIKESVQIGKGSLAWRVMEMVNPDLFLEACESIGSSSSSNLDSTGTVGSWSD